MPAAVDHPALERVASTISTLLGVVELPQGIAVGLLGPGDLPRRLAFAGVVESESIDSVSFRHAYIIAPDPCTCQGKTVESSD